MSEVPDDSASVTDWFAFGRWVSRMQDGMTPRLSDRKLAKMIGISATHLGDLKRGQTGTTPKVIKSLADTFGVGVEKAMKQAYLSQVALNVEDEYATEVLQAIQHVERSQRAVAVRIAVAAIRAFAHPGTIPTTAGRA